jgi:signal transduction histidine kinase
LVAELSLQIAGGPGAPAEAGTALRRFHPELPPDLMQVIVLLASELVSNAVKHAKAEMVAMRFHVAAEHVRVEVGDEGPGFTPEVTEPAPGTIGGWGLHLATRPTSQ